MPSEILGESWFESVTIGQFMFLMTNQNLCEGKPLSDGERGIFVKEKEGRKTEFYIHMDNFSRSAHY